ncbi:MAG: DUF481 domain-containing protein [Betaproteobacteria bacterium]|nr:DUF481 domain-containing protein [Gammaproteobacteria bacterium]MDH3438480.1 DUF481 domain-containing protein [Betaproteobacteria bacterium]
MKQFVSALVRALMLAATLVLPMLGTALADSVYLKNGDRISGKVEHMDNKHLKIKLPYAKERMLEIEMAEVVSIETDGEVNVMLGDGTLTRARIERAPEGGVILQRPGDISPVAIPLAQLAYIEPNAAESGIGVDWSGRVILGVTDASGNTDTRDAYFEANLKAAAKAWRWTTDARAKRSESEGTTTANNWLIGTRYDWFIRDPHYLYTRASAQRDTFAGIDLRWTVGAGYGYKVFDDERTKLELRVGLDYVTKKSTAPPDQDYLALGWGITFDQWIIDDKLQLYHESEGFADPKGDEGHVVLSKTGLRAPIIDNLTANLQVNLDYNSDPGPRIKSTDRTVILGLGYTF